jgi:hypothetical protein
MALLRTDRRAGLAADAVETVGDGHHHHLVVLVVEVVVLVHHAGALHQFEHVARAHLVATPATDAFLRIDGGDELRHPFAAAARTPGYHCFHLSSPARQRHWRRAAYG